MIRVLLVDDSPVEIELLSYILSSDPEISITASAYNGEDAIAEIKRERPDVITMDVNMPGIDGFETTRKIMETTPIPIIIVSASYRKENVDLSFRAMEAGALTILEKPVGPENPNFEKKKKEFIDTVKLMSEIKVVSRRSAMPLQKEKNGLIMDDKTGRNIEIIAVGASTGGPQALQILLKEMKGEVNIPVLIVQHITSGFTAGFAEWLSVSTGMNVKMPVDGEIITGGTVYIAPDGFHMGVDKNGCVKLSGDPPIKNLRPAVSYLFKSVAEVYGPRAIGVLLTGMGRDGADELKLMRDKGSITFAQDEESSVVFGMPGEAVKIGGAVCVLPPESIGSRIKEILKHK